MPITTNDQTSQGRWVGDGSEGRPSTSHPSNLSVASSGTGRSDQADSEDSNAGTPSLELEKPTQVRPEKEGGEASANQESLLRDTDPWGLKPLESKAGALRHIAASFQKSEPAAHDLKAILYRASCLTQSIMTDLELHGLGNDEVEAPLPIEFTQEGTRAETVNQAVDEVLVGLQLMKRAARSSEIVAPSVVRLYRTVKGANSYFLRSLPPTWAPSSELEAQVKDIIKEMNHPYP